MYSGLSIRCISKGDIYFMIKYGNYVMYKLMKYKILKDMISLYFASAL